MNHAIYVPRAGSVAKRVLDHLYGLPIGTELTTAEIAAAAQFDAKQAAPCLITALEAGLLKKRRHETKPVTLWSLGDGVPVVRAAPRPAPALLRSMFDISPAQRYETAPVASSFMDDWRRRRGESS